MRAFYATAKACAFSGLVAIAPLSTEFPTAWAQAGWVWTGLTYFSVYLSVVLCLLRGLPVIVEFVSRAGRPG